MKKLLTKITLLSLIGLMFAGFSLTSTNYAPLAYAESTMPTIPQPSLLPGPGEDEDQAAVQNYFRNEAIPRFISGFLGLIAGVALLGVIWAGIQYITALGEEEKLTAAKRTAIWSIAGFGITLLAYAIVSIITSLAFPEAGQEYDIGDQETVIYEDI